MARVFCVANQKGGVGKTTTCINLAAALSLKGKKVLLIDLDPQGNATSGSGIEKKSLEASIYELLLGESTFAETVIHGKGRGRYDVLPANRDLAGAEVELVNMEHRHFRLRKAIEKELGNYDFVLIDCSPSISLLTLNGLSCADGVIVPMQCEYYALEGLTDLVDTVQAVFSDMNPNLTMIGLLRVMFDPRITLQSQVSDQLKEHFGERVFDTVIPRNVRLAEAPGYGMPGVLYDPSSKGAKAYKAFAAEILSKLGHSKQG
ncbi:MAG: ParA family protein [Sutterellaceae bacterium]|nr:ParA family protein [Sutterellaceae bacterium]MDD7442594.1 ParA family protein [Sutterellaceae bacterium]MDY2867238.1 ParA family protein [Mesosutterella sp.]